MSIDLVLDHMWGLRTQLESISEDLRNLKDRVSALEAAVTTVAATASSHHDSIAARMARTEDRLERIALYLEHARA